MQKRNKREEKNKKKKNSNISSIALEIEEWPLKKRKKWFIRPRSKLAVKNYQNQKFNFKKSPQQRNAKLKTLSNSIKAQN